jgi:hypothetical protein
MPSLQGEVPTRNHEPWILTMQRLLCFIVLGLCISSCSNSAAPLERMVATLELRPRVLELAANGGQASVVIGGTSADGGYVEPAPRVLVFVRDTTIASVEAPTLVTGRRAGTTYLIAQASDWPALARDSVLVRVGSR